MAGVVFAKGVGELAAVAAAVCADTPSTATVAASTGITKRFMESEGTSGARGASSASTARRCQWPPNFDGGSGVRGSDRGITADRSNGLSNHRQTETGPARLGG